MSYKLAQAIHDALEGHKYVNGVLPVVGSAETGVIFSEFPDDFPVTGGDVYFDKNGVEYIIEESEQEMPECIIEVPKTGGKNRAIVKFIENIKSCSR